jgi:hypothetical protein
MLAVPNAREPTAARKKLWSEMKVNNCLFNQNSIR